MNTTINWKAHFIEFLAVVIGITIAFNLEQWAESRNKRELEIATLQNLKNEIQYDIDNIESVINMNREDVLLGNKLIKWKQKNISVPNDSIKKVLPAIFRMEGFTLTLDSYQSLRQSGDINIIQSSLIKKQLSKLIIRDYQETYRQYLACEKAVVDYVLYSDYFNQNYDLTLGTFKKKKIIKDVELTNRITLIVQLKAVYIEMLGKHKNLYKELKSEIDKYLEENA